MEGPVTQIVCGSANNMAAIIRAFKSAYPRINQLLDSTNTNKILNFKTRSGFHLNGFLLGKKEGELNTQSELPQSTRLFVASLSIVQSKALKPIFKPWLGVFQEFT